MDKENLHREKEQAYMKGYEDGAEKMRDFMREQLATANLNCEKAFHEGYLQGKHEEEMDRVFGGIEAIKPTKTPTNTPTDFISRQAAIDALCRECTPVGECGADCPEVEVLRNLPPVEQKHGNTR